MQDKVPFLSPDKSSLLAQGPDRGWRLYPIDSGGSAIPVRGLTDHDIVVNWRDDGRSLFITAHNEDYKKLHVFVLDIATGRRKPYKTIEPPRMVDHINDLHMTTDGRAYAYSYSLSNSDLYIVEGLQ
jgi:hypothetical protein